MPTETDPISTTFSLMFFLFGSSAMAAAFGAFVSLILLPNHFSIDFISDLIVTGLLNSVITGQYSSIEFFSNSF